MLSSRLLPGLFLIAFTSFLVGPIVIHAQFQYPPFQASDFSFVGDATISGGALRLITVPPPGGAHTAAAIWHNQTQRVTDGFVTEFTFRILNPQGVDGGGDGFAFVLHSGGTSTIGFGGGQIGYADPGGIPNSLAIEFDTYYNSNFGDPNANHLSLHTNYGGPNNASESFSLGSTSPGINFRDGAPHVVRVEYDGPTNSHQMRIFIDNFNVLTRAVDLSAILAGGGPNARIGFTAGGGLCLRK